MPSTYSHLTLYWRLLLEARRYWAHILAFSFMSLLSLPLALLTPLPLRIVADSVLGSTPLPGFIDSILPEFAIRSDTAVLTFAAVLALAAAAGLMVARMAQDAGAATAAAPRAARTTSGEGAL